MTDKTLFMKAFFGEKVPFLPENQAICGMGLALLLFQEFSCSNAAKQTNHRP